MCTKNLNHDLVVTCDETVVSTNSADEIDYWLLSDVLLAIACLVLLAAIAVKHYIKQNNNSSLTIVLVYKLLLHQYINE